MDNGIPNDKVTTVGGVRAIELLYRSVREVSSNDTVFYQSQMRLNSPNMGVLSPARYMAVLEKSPQKLKIFELAFRQLLESVNRFSERGLQFDWISVYMPVGYLKQSGCVKNISEMCKKALVRPERVCFELSYSIYDEYTGSALESMNELRRLDFKFMITGIGGPAPVLKMGSFPADYYLLHPMAVDTGQQKEKEMSCLRSLLSLISELGADAIACGVSENTQLKMLSAAECLYYTGDLSGTFMAERYMHVRSSESGSDYINK